MGNIVDFLSVTATWTSWGCGWTYHSRARPVPLVMVEYATTGGAWSSSANVGSSCTKWSHWALPVKQKNIKFSIHKDKDLKEPQRTSNVGTTGLGSTSGGALHHHHCHRSSPTMICLTTPSTSSSGRTYHSQARPVSVVMVEYPTSTVHWWSLIL